MDFLKAIEPLSHEELKERVQEKIHLLEEEQKGEKIDCLGYLIGHNPVNDNWIDKSKFGHVEVSIRCIYYGYIPKGTKMVYGITYDQNGTVSNDGKYYYVDDETYLYDFCSYIQDKGIDNEYELLDYVLIFLQSYFGFIPKIEREKMHHMIYKSLQGKAAYEPTNQRGLSDFKGKGNAMCTEYAIMAQNILSLFDFDMFLVIGREQTGDNKGEGHAFHFISFEESDTHKEVNALIDFANYVQIYNVNLEEIGSSPYMIPIENFDDDFIEKFIKNEQNIVYPDYGYFIVGNQMTELTYTRDRKYSVEKKLIPDLSVKKEKKLSI